MENSVDISARQPMSRDLGLVRLGDGPLKFEVGTAHDYVPPIFLRIVIFILYRPNQKLSTIKCS